MKVIASITKVDLFLDGDTTGQQLIDFIYGNDLEETVVTVDDDDPDVLVFSAQIN